VPIDADHTPAPPSTEYVVQDRSRGDRAGWHDFVTVNDCEHDSGGGRARHFAAGLDEDYPGGHRVVRRDTTETVVAVYDRRAGVPATPHDDSAAAARPAPTATVAARVVVIVLPEYPGRPKSAWTPDYGFDVRLREAWPTLKTVEGPYVNGVIALTWEDDPADDGELTRRSSDLVRAELHTDEELTCPSCGCRRDSIGDRDICATADAEEQADAATDG